MKMSGAQIIARLLERQGIQTIAGIPGGMNLPLYDALAASPIRHVLTRHEQGAGMIAQGMARLSGQPQVCLATSGPGATNLLTAVADAMADSIPLVAITGQVPQALLGTNAFQEIDTCAVFRPVTKQTWLVRSARQLLEVIPAAFAQAASGRPGPVLVDIPKCVQTEELEMREDGWPEPGRAAEPPAPEADKIRSAAQMIIQARQPILYLGGGVIHAGAAEAACALARRAQLPTVGTLMALGAMPVDDPLWLGMLGMHGARSTNMALEEADLLIVAGARFDDRATGRVAEFCPHASVIHIDIDRAELGKIRQPTLGITADARLALEALLDHIAPQTRPAWIERTEQLKASHGQEFPGADDIYQPYGCIRQVAGMLEPGAVITTDVGQHQMWAAQAYPFRTPRCWQTSGGLGTMGFGLPAALGAALADPSRQVVCFTGDGSLMMNIQELATAAEQGLDVKVIVLDNGHLGLVRQQQELFYNQNYHAVKFEVRTDFVALARAMGAAAFDLEGANDPQQTLARALSQPGPALVRVPIEAAANVYPMVPPGAANRVMIDGGARVGA